MQAWIIERRIKLLTDPAMIDDADLKEWLGELESDGTTIVIEDELVISKAAVEFQEIAGRRSRNSRNSRKPTPQQTPRALPALKTKRLPAGSARTDVRNVGCPECDRRFANAHALAVHVGRTHQDPTKVTEDSARPARNGTARDQRETDRAEKPHKCEQCGKGFMNAAGLGSHIKSHDSAKSSPALPPAEARTSIDKICTKCFKRFITTSKSKILCDACFFKVPA